MLERGQLTCHHGMVHAGSEKIADKHRHLIALFGAGRVDPVKKLAEGRRELAGLMVGRVFRHRARLTRTAIRCRGIFAARRETPTSVRDHVFLFLFQCAIPELTLNDGTALPAVGLGTYKLTGAARAAAMRDLGSPI